MRIHATYISKDCGGLMVSLGAKRAVNDIFGSPDVEKVPGSKSEEG